MESNALGVAPSLSQVLGKMPNAAEAFPKDYPSPPQPWNPSQGLVLTQYSSLSHHLSGISASRSTLQPPPLPRGLGGLEFPSTQGTRLGQPQTLKVPLHVHPRSLRTAEWLEPMSVAAVADKEQLCLAAEWGVGTLVGRGTPRPGQSTHPGAGSPPPGIAPA